MKKFLFIVTWMVGLMFIPLITFGAESFYEGKTIYIIVGYPAGDTFDQYARILSRRMGKYIPGKPTIIVKNMVGAGSLIAANHLYRVAKPDGLTIGHFNGGLFLSQVLGQPGIEFDALKFKFLGAISKENGVLFLNKAGGFASIEQLMESKTPVKLGGVGIGSYAPDGILRILKTAVGLPVQIVGPYKGVAEIRLATESGELTGSILAWDAVKMAWSKRLETGLAVVVLQAVSKPLPDLPKVPLAISLAKTDEARQLIDVGIHQNNTFSRPFVIGPGVPKDREEILRKAFHEAIKDKEFIEETAKVRLGIDSVTAEELGKAVAATFKITPAISAKLKDILFK